MRGTKAKRLRREVYGDLSTKSKDRKYYMISTGQWRADRLREAYQKRKDI
jgi:hypothetical protein